MSSSKSVELAQLPGTYSIHRLAPTGNPATAAAIANVLATPTTLFALLKSADELSLVCDESIPVEAEQTSGPWRALRVVGVLDFALTGVLASLTAPLATAGISVFAVSSYDTDYLLVTKDTLKPACDALQRAGFPVEHRSGD